MQSGSVRWFNNAKGWGFIATENGQDVFIHYSQIEGEGFRTLKSGDRVSFRAVDGAKGPYATAIRILETELAPIEESSAESLANHLLLDRSAASHR